MSRLITILNGPNLNLLGKRQPHIYGYDTLETVENNCRTVCRDGFEVRMRQSNHEGELVDFIHEARQTSGEKAVRRARHRHQPSPSAIAISRSHWGGGGAGGGEGHQG